MQEKNSQTLEDVLAFFREEARSNRGLGDRFERLFAEYLLKDPQYSDLLSDVWLWSEWPERWSVDVGIDLVARERSTGRYWAIQCKFLDPDTYLQKGIPCSVPSAREVSPSRAAGRKTSCTPRRARSRS